MGQKKQTEVEERLDEDFIGVYHPFPKEAPFHWRMGRMKELREEVLKKRKKRDEKWWRRIFRLCGWNRK